MSRRTGELRRLRDEHSALDPCDDLALDDLRLDGSLDATWHATAAVSTDRERWCDLKVPFESGGDKWLEALDFSKVCYTMTRTVRVVGTLDRLNRTGND